MDSIGPFLAILRNCAILLMLALLVRHGATRNVRHLLVVTLGILLVETVLHYGVVLMIQLLFYLLFTVSLLIALGIMAYRMPVSTQLNRIPSEEMPDYARKKLEKQTGLFEAAGFIRDSDVRMHYYVFSKRIHHYMRILKHPDRPVVAEIHMTQFPRSVRSIMISFSDHEIWLTTQGYADIQMLKHDRMHLNCMSSNASVPTLIQGHDSFIAPELETCLLSDNPRELHEKMMNALGTEFEEAGQVHRRGYMYVIPLRLIPGAIFRTLAGWMK